MGKYGGAEFTAATFSAQKGLIQDAAITGRSISTVARGAAWVGAAITMTADIPGSVEFAKNGIRAENAVSPWHVAVDAGASYIAIYGGFPGAVLSSAYFIISPILWVTPGVTSYSIPPTVDNTYVAPIRLK